MVMEVVFELPALLLSPAYVAVRVTFPAVVPVTVTEQAPVFFTVTRLQVVELKETAPAPDWDHVTVPNGE